MPTFHDFEYYFALDVLGLAKSTLSFVPMFASVFIILNPILYVKVYSKMEYRSLFLLAQIITIVSCAFSLLLISRWNLKVGIPDIVLYMVTHPLAGCLEHSLTMLPSFVITA